MKNPKAVTAVDVMLEFVAMLSVRMLPFSVVDPYTSSVFVYPVTPATAVVEVPGSYIKVEHPLEQFDPVTARKPLPVS